MLRLLFDVAFMLIGVAGGCLTAAMLWTVAEPIHAGPAGCAGAMNLLLAAKSGWGKSFLTQHTIEQNIEHYDKVLVLDFKDEYRGLVSKRHGPGHFRYWKAGPKERDHFTPEHYHELLRKNPRLVLARENGMNTDTWCNDVCAVAVSAARSAEGAVLVVIDEAHFVAPQSGKIPDSIKGLATTGRGEGVSATWVSQRLTEVEETVLAQCEARFLGGFGSDADLSKVSGVLEYPDELHKAGGSGIDAALADGLGFDVDGSRVEDGRFISVRRFVDDPTRDDPDTIGSEWVYSDDDGKAKLVDSRELELDSDHLGKQGNTIRVGGL
jgi:hypothetical protein